MPGTASDLTVPVTAPSDVPVLVPKTMGVPSAGMTSGASTPASSAAAPGVTSSALESNDGEDEATTTALRGRRESETILRERAHIMRDVPPTTGRSLPSLGKESDDEHKLKQFVDDDGHFSLVRNFRLADIVTLGNGFCGAMSILSSMRYLLTSERTQLYWALVYPALGFVFDAFDGKVARWRNESSMLGQELDSLADSISFGVAPAVAAFAIGMRTPLDSVCLTLFVCAGIARLARFNATVALVPKDKTGKSKYFEGLPIPSSLALVSAMAVLVSKGQIVLPDGTGKGLPFGLWRFAQDTLGVDVHCVSLAWVFWGAAMVSKTLRIPKL